MCHTPDNNMCHAAKPVKTEALKGTPLPQSWPFLEGVERVEGGEGVEGETWSGVLFLNRTTETVDYTTTLRDDMRRCKTM